jgi:hypothetical protein
MFKTSLVILTMVSGCVSNRRIYELDTGEVIGCQSAMVTGCGLVLQGCDGGIDYLCEFAVRAIDDESE